MPSCGNDYASEDLKVFFGTSLVACSFVAVHNLGSCFERNPHFLIFISFDILITGDPMLYLQK